MRWAGLGVQADDDDDEDEDEEDVREGSCVCLTTFFAWILSERCHRRVGERNVAGYGS